MQKNWGKLGKNWGKFEKKFIEKNCKNNLKKLWWKIKVEKKFKWLKNWKNIYGDHPLISFELLYIMSNLNFY